MWLKLYRKKKKISSNKVIFVEKAVLKSFKKSWSVWPVQVSTYLVCMCCACMVKSLHLCPALCGSMTVAGQAPLSLGFSQKESWGGLPYPPSEDFPNPGIKPANFTSPAMAGGFFTISVTWEAQHLPHEILDVNTHQNKIEASIGRMLFLSIFHFDSLTTVAVHLDDVHGHFS